MSIVRIGIIGGSGLYEADGLVDVRTESVATPYGTPSDDLTIGRVAGQPAELVFLPRHGRGHRLLPSEVNYRANIWALKKLGVSWVVSVSAVGSLQEEVVPGHVVVVDQFIDRTKARASTYVCMEGPAFSTRAESNLYRSWGANVIGMTNLPEAKLAREAGMSYATLAMATDYDCWHDGHDDVTVEQVIAVLQANVALARRIVRAAVPGIVALGPTSPFDSTLGSAMISDPGHMSSEQRRALALFMAQTLG